MHRFIALVVFVFGAMTLHVSALPYDEDLSYSFQAAVQQATLAVERVLGSARRPQLPEHVQHGYDDKYALVEAQADFAVALQLQSLRLLGLNERDIPKLAQWAHNGDAVTLQLDAVTTCTYDHAETRDIESDVKKQERKVMGISMGSTTTSVVTTVTDYFWTYQMHWTLSIYRGTGRSSEDVIVIGDRISKQGIKSPTNATIFPAHRAWEPMQLRLTWLFQQLASRQPDAPGNMVSFHINRTAEACHTPRRNPEIEEALAFGASVSSWWSMVMDVLQELLVLPDSRGRATNTVYSTITGIFLPPIVFEPPSGTLRGNAACQSITGSSNNSTECVVAPAHPSSRLLNLSAINLLLDECTVSLNAATESLAATFTATSSGPNTTPEESLLTSAEGKLFAAAGYSARVWRQFAGGVAYVENLLRKQLQNAVGRVLQPSDFDAYMQHHNRRLFQEQYQPLPFVYSVRRSSEHGPEGVVRIEASDSSNPIVTIHSVTGDDVQPTLTDSFATNVSISEQPLMNFALSAETRVSFSGAVHLHAWVNHVFSGEAAVHALRLKASARQFSSFIVLVGRITGPASFEPTGGAIIKDRDELDIPLNIATLPTAQEFRDAVSSLSPEQQRFATALRGMQLESTLLGVLVLHIKPQLEVLLNLPSDSLTKEIALTQDLMDMFTKYQIPADLLSFNGDEQADGAARLQAVKGHVANMRAMIARSEQESIQQRVKEQVYEHPETIRAPVPHAFAMMDDESVADAPYHSMFLGDSFGSAVESRGAASHQRAEGLRTLHKMRAAPMMMAYDSVSVSSSSVTSSPSMSSGRREGAIQESASIERAADASTNAPQQTRPEVPVGKPEQPRNAAEVPKRPSPPGLTLDLTQVPAQLDAAFLQHDTRAALRPTTLTPATEGWLHRSYPSLLSKSPNVQSWSQAGGELQQAKSAAFDLLDALSRSGALPLRHAALHVVVAATHHFDSTLVDTVVQRNVNPIEAVERSLLIIARSIHGEPVARLVGDDQLPRIAGHSTDLLLDEGAAAA